MVSIPTSMIAEGMRYLPIKTGDQFARETLEIKSTIPMIEETGVAIPIVIRTDVPLKGSLQLEIEDPKQLTALPAEKEAR